MFTITNEQRIKWFCTIQLSKPEPVEVRIKFVSKGYIYAEVKYNAEDEWEAIQPVSEDFQP